MTSTDNKQARSGWLTYENGLLLLLGFTFGLIFFDRQATSVLAPFFQDELGLNNTQLGQLASGLALAWAISAYVVSAMSDKTAVRKPFLLLSIVVFSLCSAVSGLAATFAFLISARILMGVAEGPFLPIALSIMNEESSPHRRGLNAGIMQNVFAAAMGVVLAPLVLVKLAELFDWRVAFYISGIPGLICAYLVSKYVTEPKGLAAANSGQVKSEFSIIESLGTMLSNHNLRICCLVSICMVAWFLIFLVFFPVFITGVKGVSEASMAKLMSVQGVCTVIFGFLVPAWSDRIGRKPVMIVACFLGMIAPLAALYFNGPLIVLGLLLFIGWSGTCCFPIFMGVIPGESVSPRLAASAMGLVVSIGEILGGVFGPTIAGSLADTHGLEITMYITGGLAFIAGVLSLFLKETHPGKAAIPGHIIAED